MTTRQEFYLLPFITILGACTSRPEVLARGVDAPALATDGTGLFLSASGKLARLSPATHELTTLATEVQNPSSLATDGRLLYWASRESGIVGSISIDSGASATIATGQLTPTCIAASASKVAWIDAGTTQSRPCPLNICANKDGSVVIFDAAAPSVRTVASGQWGPVACAIDDQFFYWANQYDETINRIPLDGATSAETLAPNQRASALVTSAGYLFAAINTAAAIDPAIFRVAAGGGTLQSLVSPDPTAVAIAIAADGHSIFWLESNGSVNEVSIDGGSKRLLATHENGPSAIAVDAAHIYWIALGPDGRAEIHGLPK